jgi:hypothetical protein
MNVRKICLLGSQYGIKKFVFVPVIPKNRVFCSGCDLGLTPQTVTLQLIRLAVFSMTYH